MNPFLPNNIKWFTGIALVLVIILLACKKRETSDPPGPPGPTVIGNAKVWLTRGDKTKLFSREADLSVTETVSIAYPVILVDTTHTYQTMEGFGAAMTGSSAYLINRELGAPARAALLKQLFDTVEGIGISFMRLTIGASDFSLSNFTCDDMPAGQTDFDLQHFSLSQDTLDVVPVLKEINLINPKIILLGSPWSPPPWMKTNGNMKGGQLRTDCYGVYADYFIRYIQAMQQHGIRIDAVTLQNEPLYFTANYPCMEMQAVDQLNFIKNYVGPKFALAGIQSRIIVYDHNWDNTTYATTILDDQTARQYVAGSAFHGYGGSVSAMSNVHFLHPDKDLFFTEISGGGWATDFQANLMWFMKNIFIGTTQNWSKAALLWNLALDQNDGPQNNGCGNCRGVVTINTTNNNVTYNEEYYSIAHFSKFVRPGAVRIPANPDNNLSGLYTVAFVNPDGGKVLVVCNDNTDYKIFTINQGKKKFSYSLSGKSVASFTWK